MLILQEISHRHIKLYNFLTDAAFMRNSRSHI
jgi:hypothetical protein